MPVNVLLVTATITEAAVIKGFTGKDKTGGTVCFGNVCIRILVTGVGSVATSWEMTKWLSSNSRPDLAINAGIAGSYRADIKPGDVVMPVSDCFADAGIESDNGFLTLSEAGLEDADKFPFKNGKIFAGNRFVQKAGRIIKPVTAITVNTASGYESTIARLRKKYDPDIETMEGATFFYICSSANVPFMGLRAISNMVEPRNRSHWNIPLALENLSEIFEE